MKNFSIEISPAAERDFKKLKSKLQNFNELISIIDNLSIEPRPFGVRKIKGFQNIYRIRFFSYSSYGSFIFGEEFFHKTGVNIPCCKILIIYYPFLKVYGCVDAAYEKLV